MATTKVTYSVDADGNGNLVGSSLKSDHKRQMVALAPNKQLAQVEQGHLLPTVQKFG